MPHSTSSAQAGAEYERARLPIAPPAAPEPARTPVQELAAGMVLLVGLADRLEDWSSPRYRPDAGERAEVTRELEVWRAWRARNSRLLEQVKRTGKRAPAHREPGRW